MGGGIHQPGDVIDDHQAQGNSPQHQGPAASTGDAADPEQKHAEWELEEEEVLIQPSVIRVTGQIAGEARYGCQRIDRMEHPTHVAPPESAMAVVVISIRIGKFVVMPVQSHPVNGTVLAAQRSAGGEKVLKPEGQTEGAVAEQAVIADGDAKTGCDPVENEHARDRWPAPEARKKGHNRKGVDHDHESNREHVLVIFSFALSLALARSLKKACLSLRQVRKYRSAWWRRSPDRA